MTEKRFWYDFEDCTGPKMVDFQKDKNYPLETIGEFRDIEDLLNALNEENKQLHEENQELKNKLSKIEKKIKVLQSL